MTAIFNELRFSDCQNNKDKLSLNSFRERDGSEREREKKKIGKCEIEKIVDLNYSMQVVQTLLMVDLLTHKIMHRHRFNAKKYNIIIR